MTRNGFVTKKDSSVSLAENNCHMMSITLSFGCPYHIAARVSDIFPLVQKQDPMHDDKVTKLQVCQYVCNMYFKSHCIILCFLEQLFRILFS